MRRRLAAFILATVLPLVFLVFSTGKSDAATFTGWAGYSWGDTGGTWAASSFTVPSLRAPNGAVAFWAGLGQGDPGIQQTGISCGYNNGSESCNAWYQMWPAAAHGFGYRVLPGNHMRFVVSRSGSQYTLTVINYSRGWYARTVQYYGAHENEGEAIAEAFGPLPCGFAAASFYHTSGAISRLWTWPFGGEYAVLDSAYSFTIHRT